MKSIININYRNCQIKGDIPDVLYILGMVDTLELRELVDLDNTQLKKVQRWEAKHVKPFFEDNTLVRFSFKDLSPRDFEIEGLTKDYEGAIARIVCCSMMVSLPAKLKPNENFNFQWYDIEFKSTGEVKDLTIPACCACHLTFFCKP